MNSLSHRIPHPFQQVPRALLACMLAFALLLASPLLRAQSLPVNTTVSGNHVEAVVGLPGNPLAEVILDFQDASNLSAASLGLSAQQVSLSDPALLARLPDVNLTALQSALPLLVTVEPPAAGGLSFRNTGRLEIHTHALPYAVGSSLRIFKAPLGGPFRDVTDEIARGSVRARTTYGGFSQFLIVADLRTTGAVIAEKLQWLRDKVAAVSAAERPPLDTDLDQAEAAIDSGAYATALAAIDAFGTRVQSRAGEYIPNEWRATRDVDNQSGDLIAGANTLRFSVAYLADFGQ